MTRAELADLYDRFADTLFCFLISFTNSEDESREVLQELFALLAKGKRKLDKAADLKSYLIKMARNLAIDLTRRRQTRDRAAQQLLAAPQTPIFAEADGSHPFDSTDFREGVVTAAVVNRDDLGAGLGLDDFTQDEVDAVRFVEERDNHRHAGVGRKAGGPDAQSARPRERGVEWRRVTHGAAVFCDSSGAPSGQRRRFVPR